MTAEGGCGSVALQIPYLIQDKILDSSAAIAQRSPYPGIDEISEQNAVARLYFGSNRIRRMPRISSNCKGVAGIRRERHLPLLRLSAIGQHLVKNGTNMPCRVVGRQIELDCDAFPQAVGMFEDAISRNVARQNWYRIHSYVREVRAEPTFQIRRESLNEGRLKFLGA